MTQRITERELLTELEHGQSKHANDFFNGQFEEERIKSVNRMRDMYLDDVKSGATKPDTLAFNIDHWFGEKIEINRNGKNIYQDLLGADLTHSRADDVAPGNRKPFDPAEIRRVTTDLENGTPDSLKAALDGLYYEEQVRYAKAIQALNKEDLTANKTNVELSWYPGLNKTRVLNFGVQRSAPGFENFWSNPHTVYTETIDGTGARTVKTNTDLRK